MLIACYEATRFVTVDKTPTTVEDHYDMAADVQWIICHTDPQQWLVLCRL